MQVGVLGQSQAPTVTVRYFAAAQAAAGVAAEQLTLASQAGTPTTVRTLVEDLAARHAPALARVLAVSSLIVNGVTADLDQTVDDGAQVDVLPPFSGG
jgi:molybdopterin converting factor small subunit